MSKRRQGKRSSKTSGQKTLPSGEARERLLERAAKLKRALVEFALDRYADEVYGPSMVDGVFVDDEKTTWRIEQLLADVRYDDGSSIHDRFVKAHKGLPREAREMVLGWKESVLGVFRLVGLEDDMLQTFNEVDELEYQIVSNMGSAVLRRFEDDRSWLIGWLAPLCDAWMMSGEMLRYPDETLALAAAADLRVASPRLAFRNPAILEHARELLDGERQAFIDDVGSPLVVGVPDEVLSIYVEHQRRRIEVMGENAVRKGVEVVESVEPSVEQFPEQMRQAESLGLLYDEDYGMMLATGVHEVFDYLDGRKDLDEGVDILEAWLDDDSIAPPWFREFSQHNADRLNNALRTITGNPDFVWERDGQALLRERKADWFDVPVYPGVSPLPPRLARAKAKVAKDQA